VRFVEDLSNWYVRMNRRRLKGNLGDEDWSHALSTLLTVLFTVSRVLAPFCPFITESIFQRLKPLPPHEFNLDSIHYLMIPEVEACMFDDALECSMQRMINVVNLVRVLRDRIGIPVKMPVRQVIVVHPDKGFLEDVAKMAHYIAHEVNCFEVTFSEEGEYVITKLDANMAVLGKRLKKEATSIRQALTTMGPQEVQEFIKNEGGVVLGHPLTMEDVKVLRTFREGIENFESNTDRDVVVLVDKRSDEALMNSWHAREFVNRVQQLRKKAKLAITDRVDVYFSCEDPSIQQSILAASAQVNETLKYLWTTMDRLPQNAVKITEDKDIQIAASNVHIIITEPTAQ
jgi:isoleucyl-tRNA synthetase